MIRPLTLWIALVISAPAFYQVLVTGQLSIEDALLRFVIAVPVAVVMVWAIRFITAGYGRREQRRLRRGDDGDPAVPADSP